MRHSQELLAISGAWVTNWNAKTMRHSQELLEISGAWTNQLKREGDEAQPRIIGDKRCKANQLKREDDETQPTVIGDKRCMGKQMCEKSVLDACFSCFSSHWLWVKFVLNILQNTCCSPLHSSVNIVLNARYKLLFSALYVSFAPHFWVHHLHLAPFYLSILLPTRSFSIPKICFLPLKHHCFPTFLPMFAPCFLSSGKVYIPTFSAFLCF